jgi:hypothetical protein
MVHGLTFAMFGLHTTASVSHSNSTGKRCRTKTFGSYERSAIQDRLTRAHIIEYLATLDILVDEISRGMKVRHVATYREKASELSG